MLERDLRLSISLDLDITMQICGPGLNLLFPK